jgi:hypothetical protein
VSAEEVAAVSRAMGQRGSRKSSIALLTSAEEIAAVEEAPSAEEDDEPAKPVVRVANRRKSRAAADDAEGEAPPTPSVNVLPDLTQVDKPTSTEAFEAIADERAAVEATIAVEEPRPEVPSPEVLPEISEEANTMEEDEAAATAANENNDPATTTSFPGFSQEMREKRSQALGPARKFTGRASTSTAMYDSAGHRVTGNTPSSATNGSAKQSRSSFSVAKSSTPLTAVRPFNLSSSNLGQRAQAASSSLSAASASATHERKPHTSVKATKTSQLREQRVAKVKEDQKNNRKVGASASSHLRFICSYSEYCVLICPFLFRHIGRLRLLKYARKFYGMKAQAGSSDKGSCTTSTPYTLKRLHFRKTSNQDMCAAARVVTKKMRDLRIWMCFEVMIWRKGAARLSGAEEQTARAIMRPCTVRLLTCFSNEETKLD